MTQTIILDLMRLPSTAVRHAFTGLNRAAGALKREMEIRRARAHLHTLDDRLLADMGITHGSMAEQLRHGRDWQARATR